MHEFIFKKNTYRDSVNLMLLAAQVSSLPGVSDVALLMGTPGNKQRLLAFGFDPKIVENAQPDDLCIGLEVDRAENLQAPLDMIEAFLAGKQSPSGGAGRARGAAPRTLNSAVKAAPNAKLVSISVPGEYAAAEARKALEQGLHVFLFSANVSVDDERALKKLARARGLLMMGPDCGTALINGTPLGFCNQLPSGRIGLVAASGTGAQEVMCLLAAHGEGISHVIGTGGRDLHEEIGGLMYETALEALRRDKLTEVIILVSKPPSPSVEERVLKLAGQVGKPVIVAFVGRKHWALNQPTLIGSNSTAHAAAAAAAVVNGQPVPHPLDLPQFAANHQASLSLHRDQLAPGQQFVRGLYSGGTLADEAASVLAEHLPAVRSGKGFGTVLPIADWERGEGHMVIDLGEERFTVGRPHPMIDSSIRVERIQREVRDPSVAVLLLDVVLGYNASEDPTLNLAPAIQAARGTAAAEGRALAVVTHICGTEDDFQDLARQRQAVEEAGCLVFESNVEAALAAAWIAGAGG